MATARALAFMAVLFVGTTSLGNAQPDSKRSDDVVPDMVVVSQLTNRVQILEASLTALQNSLASTQTQVARLDNNVAFIVSFHANMVTGMTNDMTAKFDDVMYNEGNGYDAMTGIFTAPISGTYAFYLKIQTVAGQHQSLYLLHNGHPIGHVYGDDDHSYDMVSTMELVHVNRGDRFWAQTTSSAEFRGSGVTRFAGFLIHAD